MRYDDMYSTPTTIGPDLMASRPQHPGMLDADDLTPGRIVVQHQQDGSTGRYRVDAEPVDGFVRMAPLNRYAREGQAWDSSLADMGMIPYVPSGMWNPTNHVTAAGDE